MNAMVGGEIVPTAPAEKPKAREALVQKPRVVKPPFVWWLLSGLVEAVLVLATLAAAFLFWVPFNTYSRHGSFDFILLATGLGSLLCVVACWWAWQKVYRYQEKRDRSELLAASAQSLTGIQFTDGSVSDFVPDGIVVMVYGGAMCFDLRHRLMRTLQRRSRLHRVIAIDWVWGLEETASVELRQLPRRGLVEAARRKFGFRARIAPALFLIGHDGEETAALWVEPGFEGSAHRLVAEVNRALGALPAESI